MPFQRCRDVGRRPQLCLLLCLLVSCGDGVFSSQASQANSGGAEGLIHTLPGAAAFSDELAQRLDKAWAARSADYKPRTRHLNPDGTPKYINRLFLESSPYLLQHAHNPMNWYPWGDEAFETARRLGRPVLLSVGYSTCHWCHVMEEESFDDEEIARYINENYIPIKVDREVRPDVDAIYMAAVQALTGRGGWPMTVWLTPDRKPFYAGTYFPARDGDRGATAGFLTLLKKLQQAYRDQPDEVAANASRFVDAIHRSLQPSAGDSLPAAEVLHEAARHYQRGFDAVHGGLQGAPKFPSSLPVRFLLRYHRRTGDKQYLRMAALTLEKMAASGMYDQVGGGFHRYSTDAQWLVPHFEKMLYDNALLARAYLEAYQLTGREDFARMARDILRYVERDMTSPEGAFYSATDADSLTPQGHREEGWFFTWTADEIDEVLGKQEGRTVRAYYGVTESGNFEGRNILNVAKPPSEVASELDISLENLLSSVEAARGKLYQARRSRPAPLRDEKILTSWNALMISAHASAALVFSDSGYATRAERAADFLLSHLQWNGRLLRSYRNGQAQHNAYLDDYAFLTAALLDLYETTGHLRWLEEALRLDRVLQEQYEDREQGGFFMTSNDHESLLAREKPSYDGAEPSGNSVAALNLLRLYEFTTDEAYRKRAERAFRAFEQVLTRTPVALSEMLLALDCYFDSPKEIIIVAPESRRQAEPLLAKLRKTFVPNRVLAVVTQGDDLAAHEKLIPLLESKTALQGQATAYVCEQRVCELPTRDPEVFQRQISKTQPLPASKQSTKP